MGFRPTDHAELEKVKSSLRYQDKYLAGLHRWLISEYWENDLLLCTLRDSQIHFSLESEEYSMQVLRRLDALGFKARLLICIDEGGEGHCICEVSSNDGFEAYYFDNRRTKIVTLFGLGEYKFIAMSPWNPEVGDTRPWEAAA